MPQRLQDICCYRSIKKIGEAASLIADNKYQKAQNIILKVLRMNPQYANALLIYSFCLSEQNKSIALSQQLKKSAFQLNNEYYESNNFDMKKIIARIKSSSSAVQKDILTLLQSTGKQWLNVLDVYLKQRDFDSCVQILRLFEHIKKPYCEYSDQNLSNIGVKYFELAMYKQSILMHELASERSPTDVMYFNNLSILNHAIGNFEKSLEYNLKTLELQPNRAKSYYVQSFILIKMGRVQQGIEKAKFALSKQPTELLFRIKVFINMMLYENESFKEVKKMLEKIVSQLKQGTITKQYFIGDDTFQESLPFLSNNIKNYQDKKISSADWETYLCMLDQYLIKGLRDKIGIRKNMKQISQKILKQLEKPQSMTLDTKQQIVEGNS